MYLKDNIMAPLYRLSVHAYEQCIPELLIEGEITGAELDVLTSFFGQAMDFNRGLDMAQSRYEASIIGETDPVLKQIYVRNQLYAKKLIPGNEEEVFSAVNDVIAKHT